jgi:glutathione S-transferase
VRGFGPRDIPDPAGVSTGRVFLRLAQERDSDAATSGPPKLLPPEDVANARERLAGAFRIIDRELSGTSFLGGERLSLADIAVGVVAYRWLALPIEREPLPNLQRWYAGLSARPAFVSSVPV